MTWNKIKPLIINTLKSYSIDRDADIPDVEIEELALIFYGRLLFRTEQMGFFNIKHRAVASKALNRILRIIIAVPLTYYERNELTQALLDEIYAQDGE